MVLQVHCIAAGGIPVFHRYSGNGATLNFSEIAPLNGIQVFGRVHSVSFRQTAGKDFVVQWRNIAEKLTLILVSKRATMTDGEFVLNCIYDAMVLFVGIDELMHVKRVDRLKKEIRPCYPVIDDILRSVDEFSEKHSSLFILSMVEVVPFSNQNSLQEKLEEWSESISSLFCCVTLHNKILVATSAWWELSPIEKNLLSLVLATNDDSTTLDIPVFLPKRSPNIAFRLISHHITNDIRVNALCGTTSQIDEFEESASFCWNPLIEIINEIPNASTEIISQNINIQDGLIGLMLMDYNVGKYLLLGTITTSKMNFDVLKIFFYQNVRKLLKENGINDNTKMRETYWYAENYKLYALVNEPKVLCVMASSTIPTHSVRLITKDLFVSLTNAKIMTDEL